MGFLDRRLMNRDDVKAAVLKCGGQIGAAQMLKISRWKIREILAGRKTGFHASPTKKIDVENPHQSVKSLRDFRALYDKDLIVPSKIKAALKRIGANGWEYEIEFQRNAGVSQTDLSNFREQFAEYIVELRSKRVWAGSPKMAAEMRAMI